MIDEILMLPLSRQCSGFIDALLLGAFLSLIFSVIKATRSVFYPGVFTIAAEDIFYCIFSSAAAFTLLMRVCYGRLRWYIFIGIFLGWIIFKLTVGDSISAVLSYIFKIIICMITAAIKVILFPLKLIYRYIVGNILLITEKLNVFIKKVCCKCKFCLKKHMMSLYNLLYTAFNPKGKNKAKGCEHRGKKKTQKQFFC